MPTIVTDERITLVEARTSTTVVSTHLTRLGLVKALLDSPTLSFGHCGGEDAHFKSLEAVVAHVAHTKQRLRAEMAQSKLKY